MQKIVLALLLVLGCVSAQNFATVGTWAKGQKYIASLNNANNANDTTFLNNVATSTLIVSPANKSINLVNSQGPTNLVRIISASDFSFKNDSVFPSVTTPNGAEEVFVGDNVVWAAVNTTNNIQQVTLSIAPNNGGAPNSVNLTKNADANLKYTILDSFTHHGRYYVIYSDGNANFNISGADNNGGNVNTFNLTNNGTGATVARCSGLSGQENALCFFVYSNSTPYQAVYQTTVNLKANGAASPASKVTMIPNNPIPAFFSPWSAGKSNGGYYSDGVNTWLSGTSSPNFTQVPVVTPGQKVVAQYPYHDQIAVFLTSAGTAANTQNITLQYLNFDGTTLKSTNNTVLTNVTSFKCVQYTDGSVYSVFGNSTNMSIGQVWGSTGMSASALQSVFAVVLAAISALFLF